MSQIEQAIVAVVQQVITASIPQIVQAVQAQLGANQAAPQAQPQQQFAQAQQFQQPQQAYVDPMANQAQPQQFAPPQAQQGAVTPEMIQSLIVPLVANEAVKAQLTATMNAMGITALPDARPDQLPELYARFQQIAQQAGGNAAPAQNYAPQQQAQFQQPQQYQPQAQQFQQPQQGATTII